MREHRHEQPLGQTRLNASSQFRAIVFCMKLPARGEVAVERNALSNGPSG